MGYPKLVFRLPQCHFYGDFRPFGRLFIEFNICNHAIYLIIIMYDYIMLFIIIYYHIFDKVTYHNIPYVT